MPRLLSSYAANKRVEDGLRRKQEQIRLDYIRATHRHLDETEKLVDDLIHINVRTPSAFEIKPPPTHNTSNLIGPHTAAIAKAASSHSHYQSVIHGGQQNLDPDQHIAASDKHSTTSGVSPANFRTELASGKVPGHPLIQVRGNEVFYQYQKQPKSWKKVEPSYKTKLLLHRNDTVIKALSNSNYRYDSELSDKTSSEDRSFSNFNAERRKSSVLSDTLRTDSLFQRRRSRRDSRLSYIGERKDSVIELPPQLSPGHTPRMLDGWRIMKWCLWNKQETTPVWATRRYAEMKNREYQKFITGKRRSDEQAKEKPSSAKATSHQEQQSQSKDSSEVARRLSVPRAKSVPVSRINVTADSDVDSDHFPSIDRGVIRPTTSILRTNTTDYDTTTHEDEARPKTTSRRRVALDTFTDDPKDLFRCDSSDDREADITYASGRKSSKSPGKTVNYDGRSVTICTWDTLAETDKESSGEEYD